MIQLKSLGQWPKCRGARGPLLLTFPRRSTWVWQWGIPMYPTNHHTGGEVPHPPQKYHILCVCLRIGYPKLGQIAMTWVIRHFQADPNDFVWTNIPRYIPYPVIQLKSLLYPIVYNIYIYIYRHTYMYSIICHSISHHLPLFQISIPIKYPIRSTKIPTFYQ